MPKARLDLRVDPGLLAAIDAARGSATRTAWIEEACAARLQPRPTVATHPIIQGETEEFVAGAGAPPRVSPKAAGVTPRFKT